MSEHHPDFAPSAPGYWVYIPQGASLAPTPAYAETSLLRERTTLGSWGLFWSITGFVLPALALLLVGVSSYMSVADRTLTWFLLLGGPVDAILGIVVSARGMSRRFLNRGAAIAGLVVGILVLTLVLVFVVGSLVALA